MFQSCIFRYQYFVKDNDYRKITPEAGGFLFYLTSNMEKYLPLPYDI